MFSLATPQLSQKLVSFGWQNWLLKSLLIIVVFAFLEIVLYRFSIHFSLYEGWVSWFFPVGLRSVMFLLLPFRYWPALFLANEWGAGIYQAIFWQTEWLKNFNGNYFYWVLERAIRLLDITYRQYWALIPIAVLKYKVTSLHFTQLRGFIYALIVCSLYRVYTSIHIAFTSNSYQDIPDERKFEMILGHFLGGFVGITTMMLAIFLVFRTWQYRHRINIPKLKNGAIQLSLLIITTLLLFSLQPDTLYLMRILAIIPLVYFLVKFGWFGITACALAFNCLLFIHLFGLNETKILVESQIYVISYALTALLLGALYEEQQTAQRELIQSNENLSSSNKELTSLTFKVQNLAKQLVSVQEKERHYLSQELHDEVGQNISALKVELKVLEKRLAKQNIELSTKQLDSVSDHIYDSVYSVLNWLRPRVLDDIGLYECLTGNYFKDRLEKSEVEYQATINKDINQLDDNLTVAIFRITQEAITNTIRYANASIFIIKCQQNAHSVDLTLIDDGKGFEVNESSPHTDSKGGFGLTGIEDRVYALGGKIKIVTFPDKGTKIAISWPLTSLEKNA
ncbi:histidine kinase [Thalassotalea sp. SU-HH00458]|uniref:histidine kinase n=1 Tax=Thalassotalea sp. SU-HH00458 TaxID=3127657 RepID=UPI0031084C52